MSVGGVGGGRGGGRAGGSGNVAGAGKADGKRVERNEKAGSLDKISRTSFELNLLVARTSARLVSPSRYMVFECSTFLFI